MSEGCPTARLPFVGLLLRAALAFVVLTGWVLAAEQTSESHAVAPMSLAGDKKDKTPSEPSQGKTALKGLEALKLPANAVIVVTEQAADALRALPRFVVLTPEQYQKMMTDLAALKARLEASRPPAPSKCLLKGKVEGDHVILQAQFEFVTERPGITVSLACGQAQASAVSLDGRTPLFRPEADGFAVTVEKAGEHQLTLDLMLLVNRREGGGGFELDLPRAAITALELELPADAREPRVGGKPLAETLLTLKEGRLSGPLGPLDKLSVTWKGATPPKGTAIRTAEGRILVRVDERQMALTTEAELTLKVMGGPVGMWRIVAPPGAEVRAAPADEGRVLPVSKEDLQGATLHTIQLKEASAEPLQVTVRATTPLPRTGLVPVGPVAVLGATRQGGSVLLSHAASGLRLELHPRGDVVRREVTAEERRRDPAAEAAFAYALTPLPEKPLANAGWAAGLSLLEVESEAVRGLLETRVNHLLRLQRGDGEAPWGWRVTTTVEATPVKTGVDHLEIALPPEYHYDEEVGVKPAALVRSVQLDSARRVLQIKLASEPLKLFSLSLEGNYPIEVGDERRATVMLPKPREARDRGGQVTIETPDDVELVAPENGNRGLELFAQDSHRKQGWRSDLLPERVEVVWQPYRPEVQAQAEVDVSLAGREARVRHVLRFGFPGKAPAQVAVRVPDALADRLRVEEPSSLAAPDPHAPGQRLINLRTGSGEKPEVRLEYSFQLPERQAGRAGEPFVVPLVVPEQVTQGETEVRVWSEPGVLPVATGGPWAELNVKEVRGHDRLPALVLRTQRVDLPLSLRLGESGGPTAVTLLVERGLVRVRVVEGGGQSYRASYLLSHLATRGLEVELPAPVPSLGLRVTLDGRTVAWETLDETGQHADGGRVVRLALSPDLVRRPAVLEVSYQLQPGRVGGGGILQTFLQPPVFHGDPGGAPVRWTVTLPTGWVPLGPEVGPGAERTWGRRGWLLAPRLAVTGADLEAWFAGPEGVRPAEDETAEVPTLVYWRNGPEGLHLAHVPQQVWLLVCSLTLLVVGLGLYFLPRKGSAPSRWFLPCVALLALAAAIGGLLWPTLLAAVIYGCEPGAAVLVLFALVQWLLHERYRRRVVFLPSFSRGRPGSSMVRNGSSAQRSRGEPSTIDAPKQPVPAPPTMAQPSPSSGPGSGIGKQGSSAK
jgi:hypothetical protein